jgi:dolichol-phosphate mannosyltransferase
MDRRIVDALRAMRERHRFIRGMVSWVGGKQVAVPYDRKSRFAGTTKYPLTKMISFALDAITSFSVVPLRLVSYLALAIIAVTFVAGAVLIAVKLLNPAYFIPGFAATMITIIFFGGVQLLALGVIGEYIGRMYESVKARPIYLLEGIYQSGPDGMAHAAAAIEPPAARPARMPVET